MKKEYLWIVGAIISMGAVKLISKALFKEDRTAKEIAEDSVAQLHLFDDMNKQTEKILDDMLEH